MASAGADVLPLDGTDSEISLPRPSLVAEWPFVAVLAAWFLAAAIASGVYWNVPVLDDWTYAWSVERLLRDGRFDVLDWSAVYPLGHALWGSAWSLILGFSFVTLRLSTLALALLASGAQYFLLRELQAPPRLALLGALAVAANPVFFLLSSSFMTDVPFVAFTLMALLCYVRAMRRGEAHLLWWGGAWAFAGFLIRQIGILTPVAALPLLLVGRQMRGLEPAAVARALGGTWMAMIIGGLAIVSLHGPTGEMTKLTDRLNWLLLIPFTTYLSYNLYVLTTVAFYLLPVLLAMGTVRGLWRTRTLLAVVAGMGAIMVALLGEIPVPLRAGGTWTLVEVGGSRGLLKGILPLVDTPWIVMTLRGAGLLAAALALMSCMRRGSSKPTEPSVSAVHARWAYGARVLDALKAVRVTSRTPLIAYLVIYLALINVLWMYNDRYVLVLLPIIAALALGRRAERPHAPRLAWAVMALFAIISVAGTRDALRFNQAVRESWESLVKSGVPPSDIDAGYAWTGWVLYAHPENLSKGLTIRDVPWVTSKRLTAYILSKTRLDGYDVTREIAWSDDARWPGPDRLLVLKRRTPDRPLILR